MSQKLNRAQIARYLSQADTLDPEDSRAYPSSRANIRRDRRDDATRNQPPPKLSPMRELGEALPVVKTFSHGVPVRLWTHRIEESAWSQLQTVAQLPFLHPHGMAIMPDVHMGKGACVGSVLPMRGALVPSSVGLDIGCGMCAVRLDLTAGGLPDQLKSIRLAIEGAVPVGMAQHQELAAPERWAPLHEGYRHLVQRTPSCSSAKSASNWALSAAATTSSKCAWMNPNRSGSCCIRAHGASVGRSGNTSLPKL